MSAVKGKKILVFTNWYFPGFKAGGPIRSCVNFAHYMKDSADLYVFTGDRDLGENNAYQDIPTNTWIKQDGIHIYYASPKKLDWNNILRTIKDIMPDHIYLNSMFSKYFSIYPMLMRWAGRINYPIVISPRGMLKETALQFKPAKKKLFLAMFRNMRMVRHLHFHATDATEVKDIRKNFGERTRVTFISNFPGIQKPYITPTGKSPGSIKIIFIGRIHPIKNLHFLLGLLKDVRCNVELTIVAAVEDEGYWNTCERIMEGLPSNVTVRILNNVEHEKLESVIKDHHLFILPTQGENFGHSIFESLAAGRPVLISDQTPWRELEKEKAGWDLSLNDPQQFIRVIEKVAAMTNVELNNLCKSAWDFAHNFIQQSDLKQQYLKLFS